MGGNERSGYCFQHLEATGPEASSLSGASWVALSRRRGQERQWESAAAGGPSVCWGLPWAYNATRCRWRGTAMPGRRCAHGRDPNSEAIYADLSVSTQQRLRLAQQLTVNFGGTVSSPQPPPPPVLPICLLNGILVACVSRKTLSRCQDTLRREGK